MLSEEQLCGSPVWAKIKMGFEEEEKKSGIANLAKVKQASLIALILMIRNGRYDIDEVKLAGLKGKVDKLNWQHARALLIYAATLQGLPVGHYLKHQPPYENLHPFTKAIREKNYHVDTQSEAYQKLGKRGGASDPKKPEGALRGLTVRLLAAHIPFDELKQPYAVIAKLAGFTNITITSTQCRSILKKGHT